ncbi:MAG: hypothetical protein IJV30_07455, partial [Oscillospiraceae bacterium]|nr:hypothetical protein [Oscillospiraceae bacterium]
KDMGTGTEAVIIKDFIQYNSLFLSSGIPVKKQLVILRSHIIIKGLGWNFVFFSYLRLMYDCIGSII